MNGHLLYTIGLNLGFQHPGQFEIRNTTGQICVVASLDYETKSTYEFPILATDQGVFDFDKL